MGDVRRTAAALGTIVPTVPRNLDRVKQGQELEGESLSEIRAMTNKP